MVFMQPKPIAKFESVLVDAFLNLEGEFGFFFLDNEEGKNFSQECATALAADGPDKLRPPLGLSFGMVVNTQAAAESFGEHGNDRFMSHPDSYVDLTTTVSAVRFLPLRDTNVSLAIEETSNVSNIHNLVKIEKVANSVDTQNGQYRAKQAERPGVCNEHVPPAKAKMCSELGRNVETLAETSRGYHVTTKASLHDELTDCNTKYLFFRPHADRNFVPIGGERQSVNQDAIVKLIGWAGNMTSSGPRFCGVLIA